MKNQELLSCPFCGAIPNKYDADWIIDHKAGCYCQDKIWIIDFSRKREQWNTRAESQELSQLKGERDELLKDKERLDFLSSKNYQVVKNALDGVHLRLSSVMDADNIRQAIDTAINSQHTK